MNMTSLKYMIEVEKCGSITNAAKKLMIGQPNLSKAIKDLELEVGFSIFVRSHKGAIPTKRGQEFIYLAKKTLTQYDALEHLCSDSAQNTVIFSLFAPRTSYISQAFSNFVRRIGSNQKLHIHFHESSSMAAIHGITNSHHALGIIQYQDVQEEYYISTLKLRQLGYESLFSFEYMITMSDDHPLAKSKEITPSLLKKYTEITLEDDCDSPLHPKKGKSGKRQIFIYDRGSQLDLLTSIPGAYMFTSPIPDKLLKGHGLVQKYYPCPYGRLQDVLIYPKGYKFSNTEKLFLHELKETIHTLTAFHE